MDVKEPAKRHVIGGVDTHKDLHVAAVVDEHDRVLGSQSFATTRQGYRQMLTWMTSFGEIQRIGIESTGSYGAGLLRFVQKAGIEVLEVTTPDTHDRRRRVSGDTRDDPPGDKLGTCLRLCDDQGVGAQRRTLGQLLRAVATGSRPCRARRENAKRSPLRACDSTQP